MGPLQEPAGPSTPPNVPVNDPAEDGNSASDTQSETALAVDGNNVISVFNDSSLFRQGTDQRFTGYATSTDNGQTFTDHGGLPQNPLGEVGDPALARATVSGRAALT